MGVTLFRHPELVSGSMPQILRNTGCGRAAPHIAAWMLKQVQHDKGVS
jgi:hypothetical protein